MSNDQQKPSVSERARIRRAKNPAPAGWKRASRKEQQAEWKKTWVVKRPAPK